MRKVLFVVSLFAFMFLFSYYPGAETIYASRSNAVGPASANPLQQSFERNAKRPRDFKIPGGSLFAEDPSDRTEVYSVMIDPGHGGNDPGASMSGLVEKEITLDIAMRINSILKASHIRTYMTRTDDVFSEPKERIFTANRKKASLFVSVHCNWFRDPWYNGIMTLYQPSRQLRKGNLDEISYADIMQGELASGLKMKNIGIRDRAELSVLKYAEMPSVLIELGFLSNKEDCSLLSSKEFRQKAAEAIASGIMKALAQID